MVTPIWWTITAETYSKELNYRKQSGIAVRGVIVHDGLRWRCEKCKNASLQLNKLGCVDTHWPLILHAPSL